MYRDCLRTVKHMTTDPRAQKNIAANFRKEFEKQRLVLEKDKHE